jgi:sulfite exporter TauE/SafE
MDLTTLKLYRLPNSLSLFPGFLAGLSTGVYCLGLCLPIFLPVLLSQKRNLRSSFSLILEFSLGRLAGYLVFGLIIGWLGQQIQSNFIHLLATLINTWNGILLIIYSLGTIDKKFCQFLPFSRIKWAILLGFLTGVNICPPFLASLSYIFNLRSAVNSLLYFLLFFLGTSLYLIPSAMLGIFTKINWLTKIARICGILAGVYFVVQNLLSF